MSGERPIVRAARSPDADDAFMFFGIERGRVDLRGLDIRRETGDIEELNRRASREELDVSAISFAAWPGCAETHDLLTVGSSFGLGYGPKLVALERRTVESLHGEVVAVPGELTSAALALRLFLPEARQRALRFDAIPAAVLAGEVAAGVVIHESQLTYAAEGLCLLADLGEWWATETGGLPLPLGANAVHHRLPKERVELFALVLADSIREALAHRDEALAHALQGGSVDPEIGGRFVGLYVNELTLDPGERGRRAVAELYRRAAAAGLLPEVEPRWAGGQR